MNKYFVVLLMFFFVGCAAQTERKESRINIMGQKVATVEEISRTFSYRVPAEGIITQCALEVRMGSGLALKSLNSAPYDGNPLLLTKGSLYTIKLQVPAKTPIIKTSDGREYAYISLFNVSGKRLVPLANGAVEMRVSFNKDKSVCRPHFEHVETKDTGRPQRDGTYLVSGDEFSSYYWGVTRFPLRKKSEAGKTVLGCEMSLAGGVQTVLKGLKLDGQEVEDPEATRFWPLKELIAIQIPASKESKPKQFGGEEYREIFIVTANGPEARLMPADNDKMDLRFTFLPVKTASGYECKIVFQHEEKQTT